MQFDISVPTCCYATERTARDSAPQDVDDGDGYECCNGTTIPLPPRTQSLWGNRKGTSLPTPVHKADTQQGRSMHPHAICSRGTSCHVLFKSKGSEWMNAFRHGSMNGPVMSGSCAKPRNSRLSIGCGPGNVPKPSYRTSSRLQEGFLLGRQVNPRPKLSNPYSSGS